MRRYRVRTYDIYIGHYTPQDGVAEYVTGLAGLKAALRELQRLGFDVHRNQQTNDWNVLVEAIEEESGHDDDITDIAASLPEESLANLPTDGASQLDHYLYGTPKHDEEAGR